MAEVGYRSSHLGEGRSYHDKFVRGPYRSAIWAVEREVVVELFERWRPRAGTRLLDFACGTGRIVALLEARAESAVGVDVSDSMLEVARGNLAQAEVRKVDLTREPFFEPHSFDVITAFRFFPNAEPILREEAMSALVRLLSAEGVLIVNNHLRREGSRFRMRALLGRIFRREGRRPPVGMSDAEVVALATRHALEIVDERSLGFLPVLSEKHPLLPRRLIEAIERRAAKVGGLSRYASLRVYALRRCGV